jgi:NDP-sugar pyrophosphorylase family protein
MQLVVPMAGLGSRFADAGYALPKPLIPVSGLPMVVRAVRDLPPCERVVFVVHPDHVREHRIDRALAAHLPNARIVVAPGLTAGQACSVRLASSALDPARPVLVAACDNTHLYDATRFARMTAAGYDAIVWTYRGDARVLVRPQAHGWVEVAADGATVTRISCKTPLSAAPLGDHAVTGCFWFRTAGVMQQAIDDLVASGERVNNEFYLDVAPNVLVRQGRRVGAFEVEKYIGWGTPHDLADYERWERYFAAARQAADASGRNHSAVA